ncbi:SusC/RagA family TonB-linked outer membrane protein [Reichenbachiella sp.]
MKKLLLSMMCSLVLLYGAQAQERTISGKVSSAEDNSTLPGVTVVLKGTTSGTTTDLDGNYKLAVPETGGTLVYSFVGLTTEEIEIGNRSVIDLVMQPDAQQLTEVVVTALGISREKASLGYAVQEVDGEELSEVPTTNIVNSLSGRIAGVQVSNTGTLGGSSRIVIRGTNSLIGENQPLFVVDGVPIDNSNFTTADQRRGADGFDYGNAAQDINPDDIESMSVLKGAAAAALYGARAANGVVMITTKKGQKGRVSVSVSSGVTFDKVFKLPDYQNEYGGGGGGAFTGQDANGDNVPAYAVDESWGPRLDNGSTARQWYSFDEGKPFYNQATPWVSNPNNIKDFFETGITLSNSVSISGGSEQGTFRVGYSNINQTGIMPNSELERHTVSFAMTQKVMEKLEVSTSGSVIRTDALGRSGTGYAGENVMQQFNQFGQRQLDMSLLRDYKNADGSQRTWNRRSYSDPSPQYSNNPYWVRYENYQDDDRTRFFGNIGLKYSFSDELSVSVKAMSDFYIDSRRERFAVGSQEISKYSEDVRFVNENNYEMMVNYNKQFNDFSLSAFVGGNIRKNTYRRNKGETQDGLAIPNLYSLSNSVGSVFVTDDGTKQQVNSFFGSASVGYKGMVYLDATLRGDKSSTLPTSENLYFYPSVTGSFVLSELSGLNSSGVISFAKVRAGWAQVGNDTNPYNVYTTYASNPQGGFGNSPVYTTPNTLNNASLKPEISNSLEFGVETKFFDNRLYLDAAFYSNETKNQIIPVQVSSTTGFGFQYINSGLITNKGIEIMLGGTPIKTASGFTWDIGVNFSRNRNELVDLYTDPNGNELTTYNVTGLFNINFTHVVGETYGQLYGYGYDRNDEGQKIVNPNGTYKATDELVPLGSSMADWTGGLTSTMSYKGVSLRALLTTSQGGEIFSQTAMWGNYSGIMAETVANNIREDGIVVDGVYADGSVNTTNIDANTHFFYNGGYSIQEANVYDASFIKLKEVALSYSLPKAWLENIFINNVTVSAIGRNLALLQSNVPHIDPELTQSANNVQGIEGAQVPGSRSFGFDLKINF